MRYTIQCTTIPSLRSLLGGIALALGMLLPVVAGAAPAVSPKGNDFINLCATGDAKTIRLALADGADPNAVWKGGSQIGKTRPLIYTGDTALKVCVRQNPHLASVEALLDAGAEVNPPAARSGSPLLGAVQLGRREVVRLLLQRGADANPTGPRGVSALQTAARRDGDIFDLLLAAGASIHTVSDDGKTVLHYAAEARNAEPAKTLLAAGLDPNVPDSAGNTPLHGSIRSPEVISVLAGAGADLDRENNKGLAPVEMGHDAALVRAFLGAGSSLLTPDARGRIKARGFSNGSTGFSHTRFFAADETRSAHDAAAASALQKAVYDSVSLETADKADIAEVPENSLLFHFTIEGTHTDAANYSYFMQSTSGASVFGKTGTNGKTARLYTPGAEDLESFPATAAAEAGHLEDLRDRYGERVCFARSVNRAPLAGYPYFIRSPDGYAVAGRTGQDGCSAEFFPPLPGHAAFSVYGGRDAVTMNVKGQKD